MSDQSGEESIDLDVIRNPNSPMFLDELQSAYLYLKPDKAVKFFKIILTFFDKKLEIDTGKEILSSLCRVLSKDTFLKIFIKNDFAITLPFTKKEYLDDLFDVLYVIVTRCPQAFDENLCMCFQKKIKNRGERSLMIITTFSQHFNEIDNPWPMLDLLFTCSDRLTKPDIVGAYSSLLSILVQSYPEFRREYGEKSWNVVCSMLDQIPDDDSQRRLAILEMLYGSLCRMAESLKKVKFLFNVAKEHLRDKSLAPYVLNLFLLLPLNSSKDLEDRVLIKMLLKQAKTSKTAALVLFRLAENEGSARILANDPIWLSTDIPDVFNTLRLLLVIFKHQDLRLNIAESVEFLDFLQRLLELKQVNRIICTIIRRIDLTKELLKNLSSSNFLYNFFSQSTEEYSSEDSFKDALLLVEKIADTCEKKGLTELRYTRELVQSCNWIFTKLIVDKAHSYNLFEDATITATKLCRIERCAKKLTELSSIEYFEKIKSDQSKKKLATKFLKAIRGE